ncbi:hypothetical protein LK996_06270 [Lysobacter sp. A6]|uniref:Uncharacterized protein n=1 Tax=Noviluteimonas lactosilytica TaxID=2888523 RepID=A0ABS8JGD1_9GAMM|nr:hypothetical protein [Lysobacter lactosilyticus]MCC8362678.1 hypothetical protein [Lysobacter lactosilyticus]
MLTFTLVVVAGFAAWQCRDAMKRYVEFDATSQMVTPMATPPSATTFAGAPPVLQLGARVDGGVPAMTPLGAPTIKEAPTQVVAFDGKRGEIVIDPRAIDALRHGEYVFARYGEHVVAHRVHRKERRDDHTYVAMAGVDPLDGGPLATYASYHLYDDGTVSHSVNHDGVGFEARGMAGESIAFENLRTNDAPAAPPHAH